MKFAITVGIPCAGKSEFCRWLQEREGHIIINLDTIRIAMYGEIEILPAAEVFILATAQTMVRHYLLQGSNVIVDACNLTKDKRRIWIDIAREYKLPLEMYWLDTSFTLCKKINEARDYLPRKVLEKMESTLEYPCAAEGGRSVPVEVYVTTPKNHVNGEVVIDGKLRKKNI